MENSNDNFDKIVKGLELSYEEMVKFKISKNSPIVIEKDGKIEKLDPTTVPPTTTYKWH